MTVFRLPLALFAVGFVAFASTAGMAFTSSNVVPETSLDAYVQAQGVNDLKPAGCGGSLTGIVTGSGTITGTGSADLILGSPGVDTVNAGAGQDCILGGDGNDALNGEGDDDDFYGGLGTDVCTGGPGTDTFPGGDCETATQ